MAFFESGSAMENSNSRYHFAVSFLLVFIFWAIPAIGDWRISHVAPGQSLGTYAPQRMILSDPDTGEIHIFFYGHAVTHAIVNGDDVEWDIVDPSAEGRGPISAAWTQDGRLGVAWGDAIQRRVFLAVQDEDGEWNVREVDDALPMIWGASAIALAFDGMGNAIIGTRGYDAQAREEIVRLIQVSDTTTTLFETADHDGVAELLRGADDVVWYFYSTFDDGGLATIDIDSGLIWEEWTPWNLTPSGEMVDPGVALWPIDNGVAGAVVGSRFVSGYKDSYEDYECAIVRNFESDLPGQYRDLPLPFDLPNEIDAVAGWGTDDGELSVVMGNRGRLVLADYDASGALSPDSTVLEVSSAPDSRDPQLRLDAVRGVDGHPVASMIDEGRLELVDHDGYDWMRRVLADSAITHSPHIWIDSSLPSPVIELLSYSFADEPRLRLDRFDSTWSTMTWPLPVSPDEYESSVNLSAARTEDGTWYALIEYHLYPGWRVAVFRLDADEWVPVTLPVMLESSLDPQMRIGADGEIYIGARSLGGYQVLRRAGDEWDVFDTADQFPLSPMEQADFYVDTNGDFHVLGTTPAGLSLRYFFYDTDAGEWNRETVDAPLSRCSASSRIRVVPAGDGSQVVAMCLSPWVHDDDQGKLTAYVRTDVGDWHSIPIHNAMWSGAEGGIDGVWTGDTAKFVISHEGKMNVIQVDGLSVESDSIDGAVGGGAIDLLIAESGDEFIAYDSAAGVALAYPSELGDTLERPWTPDAPHAAVPMSELPLERYDGRCSDPGDDDSWDDDGNDDIADDDLSADDDSGDPGDDDDSGNHHGGSDSDDSSWCG
ncbi:MAG: hypothetical protein IT350_09740 [Deltaproteobacteria bacterium]|nr:hypothetical protein [Deltaproteobacteria bacterium]